MATLNTVELQIESNGDYVSVDIDQSVSFGINFQMTDITHPTNTRIPYSVQISLPNTRKNSDLFNHIWKPDSKINKFNPLTRTNFRLYINNNLYQSGYLQLESYTDNAFKIRLYGGLGDYFYTMSDQDGMRLKDLDFGSKFDHIVNKEFVYNCWNEGRTYYNTSSQPMNDYFCYAMTYQGEYDNFDNAKVSGESDYEDVTWKRDGNEYTTNGDMREHDRSYEMGEIQYDGEYMSYYQKPMIGLKEIINKIVGNPDENVTGIMQEKGWTTNLDKTFFNKNNPYWNDLWMICPEYRISSDAAQTSIPTPATGTSITPPAKGYYINVKGEIKTEVAVPIGEAASLHASIPLRFRFQNDNHKNTKLKKTRSTPHQSRIPGPLRNIRIRLRRINV